MKKHLNKSIVITGASATGKTTLCRRLIVYFGLQPLPVHMTRELRDGEIKNVDGVFISEKEFKARFQRGNYMQNSIESAYFDGAYYGCPREWIDLTINGDNRCFVCPTVKMAKKIKKVLGQKIFWIHLVTNKNVRLERMMKRRPDMRIKDFNGRIKRGDILVDTKGHNLIIDTSHLNAWEIFFHALTRL